MSQPSSARPSAALDLIRLTAPWLGVVLGMTVATYSVVRYETSIVVTYALLVVGLVAWVVGGRTGRITGAAQAALAAPPVVQLGSVIAACLLVVAVIHVRVRPYTYLTAGQGWTVRWIFAGSAALAAALLLAAAHRRVPLVTPVAVAAVGYLVAAVLLIHWDAHPKIDVWVTLQQASDGIAHGKNIYALNWTGSPGVQDAFTYLPFTALLLAPGRWLAGDVRWMLVLVTLIGVTLVYLLGTRHTTATGDGESSARGSAAPGPGAAGIAAAGAAVLLLLMPGTPTQVEQAWTEPLLMACLAGWAFGMRRKLPLLSILALALGLASKQHLVLLLPMLAAWPRFGWRRTLTSMVLAGVFVLPWFIASPADFVHDTVTVLVNFQPLRFADTLFIAAMQDLNWTPSFWLTGALVIAVVGASAVLVRRRDPGLPEVLRWAALVLFVANLVNKQAFYNQYWLVAALLVISLACPDQPAGAERLTPLADRRRAGAAT